MKNFCSDVILGYDFLWHHSHIEISLEGSKLVLSICGLPTINVQYLSLFNNLTPDFKPIAIKLEGIQWKKVYKIKS